MGSMKYYIIALLVALLCSCLQIILKKLATKEDEKGKKSFLNVNVLVVYGMYVIVTLINSFLMRYIPMAQLSILNASSYIYVPILGYIFLREKLNRDKMLGIFTIFLGIVIFSV